MPEDSVVPEVTLQDPASPQPPTRSSKKLLWGMLLAFAFMALVLWKFVGMLNASRAPSNVGNVSTLQSAISLYISDNEGLHPAALDAPPFLGKYIDAIPMLDLARYGGEKSNKVESYAFPERWWEPPFKLRNTGHWAYDPVRAQVIIDSNLLDRSGRPLYRYGYE